MPIDELHIQIGKNVESFNISAYKLSYYLIKKFNINNKTITNFNIYKGSQTEFYFDYYKTPGDSIFHNLFDILQFCYVKYYILTVFDLKKFVNDDLKLFNISNMEEFNKRAYKSDEDRNNGEIIKDEYLNKDKIYADLYNYFNTGYDENNKIDYNNWILDKSIIGNYDLNSKEQFYYFSNSHRNVRRYSNHSSLKSTIEHHLLILVFRDIIKQSLIKVTIKKDID